MLSQWLYERKQALSRLEGGLPYHHHHHDYETPVGRWPRPLANQGLRALPVRGQLWHLLAGVTGEWSMTPTLAVTSTPSPLSLSLSLDHHSS